LIAEKKDGSDISVKKDIALCYHNRKDYTNAIKYYDEILAAQPDDYTAKFNKALAYHALNKYEDAISLYKELLNVKSEKAVKDNLNNALVSRGHELLALEEYEEAITDFKSALKEGYTDGYAYYGLAKAYRATGNNTKASENYEKAISLDPDKTLYSAEYSDFISSMYKVTNTAQSGNVDVGDIKLLEIPIEVDTQTKDEVSKDTVIKSSSITIKQNEDLIAEGDKNFKSNNYDSALKNYQDALQLVPNDAETLLKIGLIYKLKEDNIKAINFYQKAIIVNPDYTDGWFNLGLAYANENNPIESQKSLERVISLDADYNYGYAYYALAKAFEQQNKTSEAIKNYKLFIKHNNDKEMIEAVQAQIKVLQ
jgi:tetratricopeptide (TPR) repeat protein